MKSQIKYISAILLFIFSNNLIAYSISFHKCMKENEAIHSDIHTDCCSNDICDDSHESDSSIHFDNVSCCEKIQYPISTENIEKYHLQILFNNYFQESTYLPHSANKVVTQLHKNCCLDYKKKSLAFLSIYRI